MCEPKYCGNLLDSSRYKKIQFPYQIKQEKDENIQEKDDLKSRKRNVIFVGPQEWCLPKKYEKECDILYNFEVRPDDVWIVSFPYSGVALVQEMIWALIHNCDIKKAEEETLDVRSPFFEASIYVEDEIVSHIHKESSSPQECLELLRKYTIPRWQVLRDTMKRRIIKTHLPLSLLPHSLMSVGCKVIYVARNPKDVMTLAYLNGKTHRHENFEMFFKKLQQNKEYCCPYWSHISEGWEKQNNTNIMFLWYEEAVKNTLSTIKKVASFFGIHASEEQMSKLEQHLQIESFKTKAKLSQVILKNFITCGDESIRSSDIDDEEFVVRKIEEWIQESLKSSTLKLSDILLMK